MVRYAYRELKAHGLSDAEIEHSKAFKTAVVLDKGFSEETQNIDDEYRYDFVIEGDSVIISIAVSGFSLFYSMNVEEIDYLSGVVSKIGLEHIDENNVLLTLTVPIY